MIATRQITVTINGQKCVGAEGQTILDIAKAQGIDIPTLCYLKHLSPWGGCRMCIVEIAGSPKVVPACSTPAADASVVTTNSERLVRLRRQTLELLFSERNHICPICPYNKGDCGLQHQGYLHGIDAISVPYLYPALPVDLSGRYFGLDHNRCILCTRCVRACDEMEGVHTLDIVNRGIHNRVVVDGLVDFGRSDTCTQCGACVAACPTGALFDKQAAFLGQLTKSQQVRTHCVECPVGCGLIVYVRDDRIVNVMGDLDNPVSRGHLCVRGRYQTWAEPRRRITQPLVRRDGRLQPATWDEALGVLARLRDQVPAFERGLIASPRLTQETFRAIEGLKDEFSRTAVLVAADEAALCQSALESPGELGDLDNADAIILLGAQPSRDNGVVAAQIRVAARKRGAKLIVLGCRKSNLDYYADIVAREVGLEHAFWDQVAAALGNAQRPVLVFGPGAMTPVGVTVLEKLIQLFETKGQGQPPRLLPLSVSPNSLALAANCTVELIEDVAPWLDISPLRYLHVVVSDEPDGGARWLAEKYASVLLGEVESLVVQASYASALTEQAAVVLPSTIWSERSGTMYSLEGRALNLTAAVSPRGEARDDQTILEKVFA